MIILGIDPGYAIVGFGAVEYNGYHFKMLEYGAITTEAGVLFELRLNDIYDQMCELITRVKPDALSIERLYFTNNQKTGIDVAQARGVILLAAFKCGIPIYEYTPLQVKQSIVGYGKAEKKQVMEMTKMFLHLETVPKPDDAADALAIAICHAHSASSKMPLRGMVGR
ncbi:MAG: crossover junction endodeoxyribonuclease RuvC [Oscillospiraceae bacterium]|nr:crossover junction endodeoxyribonuclease RuvC [Oscillospiraceae bacterium]MBQ3049497.1 crossover junction endodeoxyribonuclease RuvC [Oscillospiraceae bacterium]MBQ9939109.1 crossover junction endodeoxyribonuclease RuvC [Oscillospiraceae bacterium]